VETLTTLGTAVLFSAAIPHQGGRHHVNERWPEYWAQKFRPRGYKAFDPFRTSVWGDQRVESWYQQNLVPYLAHERVDELQLAGTALSAVRALPSLIRPDLYLRSARSAEEAALISARPEIRAVRQAGTDLRRLVQRPGKQSSSPGSDAEQERDDSRSGFSAR
jgi:hypothetical protein